jgi:hypothetical protein
LNQANQAIQFKEKREKTFEVKVNNVLIKKEIKLSWLMFRFSLRRKESFTEVEIKEKFK